MDPNKPVSGELIALLPRFGRYDEVRDSALAEAGAIRTAVEAVLSGMKFVSNS
jgi:hypothetical protein